MVFCWWIVHKYNIFNINDNGVMVMTDSEMREQDMMRIACVNPSAGHH